MPRQTSVLSISLPKSLTKEVDKLSKQTSQTRSELMRSALREYMLNLQEDAELLKVAQERMKSFKKGSGLTHEQVWG